MTYEQITCKFCNSTEVIKNGKRRNSQYYICKECNRGFVDNDALPRMKYPVQVINSAFYWHYEGSSLNEIRDHIIQRNALYPSVSTIHNWITNLRMIQVENPKDVNQK